MKNETGLLLRILFLALLFISCQEHKSKNIEKPILNLANNMIKESSKFSGNFSGLNNGKEIFVALKSGDSSTEISGVLTMDGEQAVINAIENNGSCSGSIIESNSTKSYAITIIFLEDKMNFSITFPEYNNQVLKLVLSKSDTTVPVKKVTTGKELNPNVVGKWRFTEVISSGSGGFYASFSTDYFLMVNADGTAATWIGASAGGTNAYSIDGDYGSNIEQFHWYTSGKSFYFVEVQSKQESNVTYYVEPSVMLFSVGDDKRLYERVE